MPKLSLHHCIEAIAASFLALALSGCALQTTATSVPDTFDGAPIKGNVHGGQQAVVGAHVFLLAANTTGYGAASVSLLKVTGSNTALDTNASNPTFGDYYVTTDATGAFSISADYACTTGQQVYVYVNGGDSGAGPNPSTGLMAVLGACPVAGTFATQFPLIQVNELTTIAAAYALSGFATDATHVSSSGTTLALVDVANAFTNASNLVSIVTGQALATTPGSVGTGFASNAGKVPQTEINTLGNILSACVNTNNTTATNCSTLFSNAMNGVTAPTETATAAINIAHHPASNVAALFALQASIPAFQSTLTAAPNDWTIVINFTANLAGGSNQFNGIAVDGAGQVWLSNGGGIIKLSPSGVELSGVSGYFGGSLNYAYAIAIDTKGDAWVTDYTSNKVVGFSPTGSIVSGASGYPVGGNPYSIAVDASNNLWVANSALLSHSASVPYSVSELDSSNGNNLNGSPFTGGGLNTPEAIAIDAAGSAWVANLGGYATQISSTGTLTAYSNPGPLAFIEPATVAIDNAGNKWFADVYGSTNAGWYITELVGSGAGFTDNTYSAQGQQMSQANTSIDGSGHVWVTTFGNGTNANYSNWVGEFSSTGALLSPSNGFHDPNLFCQTASGMAIDGSGNVSISCAGPSGIMEYVGAATPVVTPLVANLMPPYNKAASKP